VAEEPERTEFLPPQPAGPEPELGSAPQPEAPPGGWQPPQHAQQPQPQTWQQPPPGAAYTPQPAQPVQPDNGPAVAGFVLSIVAGGLLVLSAGLSSVVSLGCAITGMVYSRKGTQNVASGKTTRHESLAKAGWIIGIVSLVLSVIATISWTVLLLDEEAREDFEREFDNSESVRAGLRAAAAAGRVLLG